MDYESPLEYDGDVIYEHSLPETTEVMCSGDPSLDAFPLLSDIWKTGKKVHFFFLSRSHETCNIVD
jgi:hypothetical protein